MHVPPYRLSRRYDSLAFFATLVLAASLCMHENRRGHCDLGVTSIGSLIPHLQILATTHLAHLHHQVVIALRQCYAVTSPLLFSMAAIVVDDPLAVQVQERAVVRGGVELVTALRPGREKTAAPDAEVLGLPDVREAAVVHVDVRQNLCMSRGQSSEVRDTALSLVVEVVALQTLGQRWLGCRDFGIVGIWHDTAVHNRTTESGPICAGASVSPSPTIHNLCGFAVHSEGEVLSVHVSNLGCAPV